MITNYAVNTAIDYILSHAEEELTLEDVADYCHFSKYYFDRLFKEQTKESVYAYIKRIKLEQSAFRLKTEKERRITEIGADYGYSASNYSSAFKQHYHMTPVDFRRKSRQYSVEHPFFHNEKWHMESFEECNARITMENVPDYFVLYERRFGSYESLSRSWGGFMEKYRDYVSSGTVFLERTYDDPAVTDKGSCLYDVCMSVDRDCPSFNMGVIEGGRCAVYHFKGHAKYIYAAYQTMFLVWLPQTRYELDVKRSMFDIYHRIEEDTMYMEMDICLPVKEK